MSKNLSSRRGGAGIVTGLLAVVIMITGTLAWQSISQKAANNVKDPGRYVGGRLHDDFDDEQDWYVGANKDVYVENYSGQNPNNTGDKGLSIYVRVRLSEYMEIGEGAGLFTLTGNDPSDYQDLDQVDSDATRQEDLANEADSLVAGGSILDLNSWSVHIPDGTAEKDSNGFHDYWDWNMGGSKTFMPTFNKDNESLLTDRTEYGQNQFVGAPAESNNASYIDPLYDNQMETHSPKTTEFTAAVLTMAQWMDMGHPTEDSSGNGYWVGDTDGWFYWSKALPPGAATGLLLDEITLIKEMEDPFYYGIHVTAQMASGGEWGDPAGPTGFYGDSLTTDGKFLLDQAAGLLPTINSVTIVQGDVVYVRAGQSISLTADVDIKNPTGDASEKAVTWAISPNNPAFVNGTLTTQASDASSVYNVTVSTAALPTVKTDTVKIVIYPNEGVGVVGPMIDGKVYINYGDNTYKEILSDGTLGDFKCAGMNQVIGDYDDIAMVSLELDGRKYLGPNPPDDNSVAYVGADGKLGTEDDEKWWYNPDHANMVDSPFKMNVGSVFTDENGVVWTILGEESGHKILMTKYVHGVGTQYNTTNVWTNLDSSNLKVELQSFYQNIAGQDIRDAAVAYASQPINDYRTAQGGYDQLENQVGGMSHPGTMVPSVSGSDAIFVLSVSECNTYFTTSTERQARDTAGVASRWWLRSPGNASPNAITGVVQDGGIYPGMANLTDMGYRPAVWVKIPS